MIKIQWLSPIWSQKHQNNAKLQKLSNYLNCIDLMSKRSKQRKTTKVIKIQWLASIWCQKWSNYDEFAPIWRQNDLKCWGSRKTFKTTQNYKSNQITINCIDLMSKTAKQSKTTKAIKLDVKTSKNDELRRKPFKTSKLQKWTKYNDLHRYDVKSDQYTMTCIDLASKRSKISRYVAKHSKQHKTAKVIKLQWIASI